MFDGPCRGSGQPAAPQAIQSAAGITFSIHAICVIQVGYVGERTDSGIFLARACCWFDVYSVLKRWFNVVVLAGGGLVKWHAVIVNL
jgi:hypothetical protein